VASTQTIPEFRTEEAVSLWDVLPTPVKSEQVQGMEDLDQAYGYILYRTRLKKVAEGELVLDQLHDYAQVYVDGRLVGTLDRRLGQNKLALQAASGARLDILVENTGRINFSAALRGERKWITKQVTLGGEVLLGWEIYPLPMVDVAKVPFKKAKCEGACFYRGTLRANKQLDTFLDASAFTKGQVWLNGKAWGACGVSGRRRRCTCLGRG
jgi:beta-galactosidase